MCVVHDSHAPQAMVVSGQIDVCCTMLVDTMQHLQVIFMFGEIDCREGLTMAVDKLKYETVDAAMDVLLGIYKGAVPFNLQFILHHTCVAGCLT